MPARDSEDQYVLARIKNQTGVAEGTNLPPPAVGGFRVPFVSNLRILRTNRVQGTSQFTVAWDEPSADNISHYAVYVINAVNNNAPPLGPFNSATSPAQISIPGQDISRIIFLVQTVLKNGLVSDFENSPTCSSITSTIGKTYETTATTTNATPLTLQTLIAPASTTIRVATTVVARRTGGAAGTAEDGASYVITGTFKNVAGTATQVGATSVLSTNEDQAAWACVYAVSASSILINVTGAANNTINWAAISTTYQIS